MFRHLCFRRAKHMYVFTFSHGFAVHLGPQPVNIDYDTLYRSSTNQRLIVKY